MPGPFSFEVDRLSPAKPPYSDSCPKCLYSDMVLVPYATTTERNNLIAFYRHRKCGHQWTCHWRPQWDSSWVA